MNAERFREVVSGRRRGLVAVLLRSIFAAISLPYLLVTQRRNRRYDRRSELIQTAGVPTISVGNLTLGGTGKTPMVEWIARWLREHHVRVTLVSRGYKSGKDAVNDEALTLEELLPDVPHVQDADRVSAARMAVEEFAAQMILLDDAFQHRRIHRDLDIVLIDATEPFGFDHLFPRGTLRESLVGLGRADLIAITRADCVPSDELQRISTRIRQYNAVSPLIQVTHAPRCLRSANGLERPLDDLRGARIAAFCGIGNPRGFEKTIQACGYELAELRTFPDHHGYTRDDIENLITWVKGAPDCDAVLCTHKDLVKVGVQQLETKPLYALAVGVGFTQGQQALEEKLQQCLENVEIDPVYDPS